MLWKKRRISQFKIKNDPIDKKKLQPDQKVLFSENTSSISTVNAYNEPNS